MAVLDIPIHHRSKPPRRSNTRTCPRILTPQRTARRRLSRSRVGRAMAAAPTSTAIASKEACRETGTLPNVPSRPTSTASTWTTSQTGITVCWGKMMTGENHELTPRRQDSATSAPTIAPSRRASSTAGNTIGAKKKQRRIPPRPQPPRRVPQDQEPPRWGLR